MAKKFITRADIDGLRRTVLWNLKNLSENIEVSNTILLQLLDAAEAYHALNKSEQIHLGVMSDVKIKNLRDEFAMRVLPATLECHHGNKAEAVKSAYELADLMLEARKQCS